MSNNQDNGNAAALREAATTVYNVLERLSTFTLHIGDIGHKREFNHRVCLAKNRLDAALSAPARNCDRFKTREEAQRYFDNVVCLHFNRCGPINCKGCRYDRITNPHRGDCLAQWLFEPAERKGEGDAR